MTIDPSLLFLAQDAAPAPGAGGGLGFMPLLLLMLVMMYFLTIRPQRKKQKELQAQVDAMKTGDKVVTLGGIHGLLANIKDRTVIIKVADNVKIEVEKSSIGTVIKKETGASKESEAREVEAEALPDKS